MTSHLSRVDFEADAVAELRDEGMPPVGVNLRVAERLSGLSSQDLLRAIFRGELDGRRVNGRIIILYASLQHYVLGLPAAGGR